MSRKVIGKVEVEGKLVALTPISVGGLGEGEHVDLELAEDGTGCCYVPGTSLAGPMRAWLASRLDGKENHPLIRSLFGYVDGNDGQASALFIHDSPIKEKDVRRERRHGIAINEKTGTTKENFFYTRALLPQGTSLTLRMELDILSKDDPAPGALISVIDALQRGEIRFGAAKTRGMGKMKLEPNPKIYYYDFSNANALDQWLRREPAAVCGLEKFKEKFKENLPKLETARTYTITIHWRAASPVMVKAGRDGVETDMLPLMSGVGKEGKLAPVIPGSSIKGVLRAQARRILNTLFNPPEKPKEADDEERWDILKDLFGSKERAGRLRVDDVYYHQAIPFEDWLDEKINTSEEQEQGKIDMNSITERRQHVAIDRFTGGASNRALYSARPVKREGKWDPITLTLDNATEQELALLKLLVRDLKDGYIPIGFGSRRGLGEIEVDNLIYEGFPDDSILQDAWEKFIKSNTENFEGGEGQ